MINNITIIFFILTLHQYWCIIFIYKYYAEIGVMLESKFLKNERLFYQVRAISNKFRFRILELTQRDQLSITELSSALKLSYTKCADYVKILENYELINKRREGKEARIKSKVKINGNQIIF